MKQLQEALTIKFKELLKKKDPQKAAQIIKKEYFATGPDKKNLKKSARDFKKKYGYTLRRSSDDEQVLQERMKHVEACFDATLEVAKETAMRQMLLDKIAKKQLKSAKVKLNKKQFVNTFRSLHDLMHLENTPEANQHNEKVVSLMLYNQKLITEDQFVALRTEQMKKANIAGIEDFVALEAGDPKTPLLDLIKSEAASLQEKAQYAEKGTEDILNFYQNNPEKLKKAFRAVEASRADLFRTGFLIYEDNNYGWNKNATEQELAWVKENLDRYGCRNSTKYAPLDSMSNPYMSIMGITEMIECYDYGKVRNIEDDYSALGRYRYDVGLGLSPYALMSRMENDQKFNQNLEAMGMQGAKKTSYTLGFTVYKKGDDVLIARDTLSSTAPFKMKRDVAKPTEFFKANIRADVSELYEQYKECNTGTGSQAYDNIERALKNIKIATETFPDDTSKGSLDEYKEMFKNLKTMAKTYLEHKESDFRKRGITEPEGGYTNHSQLAKNSYERKRIELAESILKFTNSKIEAIDLVKQYKDTRDKLDKVQDINPTMNQPEIINAEVNVADKKDENEKENQPEKNPKDKIPTNIKELEKEQNKLEGKEKTKEKRTKSSGNIMEENNKLQLDPPAKKGF